MDYQPPGPALDAVAAEWIAPRLVEQFGAVCRTVPTGFDAYARILHPVDPVDPGGPAQRRWAEVAESNGRTVHPLAQFARITLPAPGSGDRVAPLPEYHAPMAADLGSAGLGTLCEVLQRHTPDGSQCWFGVWEGRGELPGGGAVGFATHAAAASRPRDAPAEWQLDLRAARFALPGRAYFLFTGPLDDALRIGSWVTEDWFLPRPPNLFWPDNRRWCVASEIDFDSTLVGGPTDLIDEVIRRDDLEAWPIGPLDSLAWDGDTINQP